MGYEGGWDEWGRSVGVGISSCLQVKEKIQCVLFNYRTLDRINCRIMKGGKNTPKP